MKISLKVTGLPKAFKSKAEEIEHEVEEKVDGIALAQVFEAKLRELVYKISSEFQEVGNEAATEPEVPEDPDPSGFPTPPGQAMASGSPNLDHLKEVEGEDSGPPSDEEGNSEPSTTQPPSAAISTAPPPSGDGTEA